jgi:hypothetical protein
MEPERRQPQRSAKRQQPETKPKQPPKQQPKQQPGRWPALPTAPPSVSVDLGLAPPPSFPLDPHLCALIAAHLERRDCLALLHVCRYWWQALGCGCSLAQAWIADRVAALRFTDTSLGSSDGLSDSSQANQPAAAAAASDVQEPVWPSTEQRLRQLAFAYRLQWDGLLPRQGRWNLQRFAERLFPNRAARNRLLRWHRLDYLAGALLDDADEQAPKRRKRWGPSRRRCDGPSLLGYAVLHGPPAWLHANVFTTALFDELAETRMPPPLASRALVAVAAVCQDIHLEAIAVWLVLQGWPLPLLVDTLAQLQRLIEQPAEHRRCRPLHVQFHSTAVATALRRTELAYIEQAQAMCLQLAALRINLCAALLRRPPYSFALRWACEQPAFALLSLLLAHSAPSASDYAAVVRALPNDISMDGFPLTLDQVAQVPSESFGTAARRWWLQRARLDDATARRFHRFLIDEPHDGDAAVALQQPGLLAALVRSYCQQHTTNPEHYWTHTALLEFLREARHCAEFALDNYAWTQHVGDYRALVVDLFDGAPPRALLNLQGPISPYEHAKAIHYRLLQEAQVE